MKKLKIDNPNLNFYIHRYKTIKESSPTGNTIKTCDTIKAIVFSLLIALGFGMFVVLGMPVLPFEDSMIICNHGMIKMTSFGIVYVIATTFLGVVLPVVSVSFFHFRILCLVSSFHAVVSVIYNFFF